MHSYNWGYDGAYLCVKNQLHQIIMALGLTELTIDGLLTIDF